MIPQTYNNLIKETNDKYLEKIGEYLSVTEKENSALVIFDKLNLGILDDILMDIYKQVEASANKGNKKIVKVIFEANSLVKLQSFDNGTPYIYILGEEFEFFKPEDYFELIDVFLNNMCDKFGIVYQKMVW